MWELLMTGWEYVDGTSLERLKPCHCWTSCCFRRDQQGVTFSSTVPVPSPCINKWYSNLHHLCSKPAGPVGGMWTSLHVPRVAPLGWAQFMACHPLLMCHRLNHLGGPPLTPDALECNFLVPTLKLAAIQPLNDCVVFAK